MDTESVTVAVRVRPFSKHEESIHQDCIVEMEGSTTILTDPENGEKRRFTFDYSYWSFDRSQAFADQEVVFGNLGNTILDAAWNGFNSSLFAYGQTGSGKSYTMVGGKDIEQRGMMRRVNEALFHRLEADTEAKQFTVKVSFLEIYRENIRDLLNPQRNPPPLRVRQHPKIGIYVENLSKHMVSNYNQVENLMAQGFAVRVVGATKMNDESSRSHCAFIIELTRVVGEGEMQRTISSSMTLVDLAGSERQSKTQATGVRLKEACAINTSLSALGNVISALSHNSLIKLGLKKGRTKRIPYRDSVLTRLLTDSLGGNSKTIMLAAIGPASRNYDETLSTLRYADRAKQIKNKPVRNESPQDKRIRELEEEIAKLRDQLTDVEAKKSHTAEDADQTDDSNVESYVMEIEALKGQLVSSESIRKELAMGLEDAAVQAQRLQKEREEYLRKAGVATENLRGALFGEKDALLPPCLINISPDAVFSGSLILALKHAPETENQTLLGRGEKCNIIMKDSDIHDVHAVFTVRVGATLEASQCFVRPAEGANIKINGKNASGAPPDSAGWLLANGDCLYLGKKTFVRYCIGTIPKGSPDEYYKQMTLGQLGSREPAAPPAPAAPEVALVCAPAPIGESDMVVYPEDVDGSAGLLAQIVAVDRLCDEANDIAESINQRIVFSLNVIRDGEVGKSGLTSGVEIVVSFQDTGEIQFWDIKRLEGKIEELKDKQANYSPVADLPSADTEDDGSLGSMPLADEPPTAQFAIAELPPMPFEGDSPAVPAHVLSGNSGASAVSVPVPPHIQPLDDSPSLVQAHMPPHMSAPSPSFHGPYIMPAIQVPPGCPFNPNTAQTMIAVADMTFTNRLTLTQLSQPTAADLDEFYERVGIPSFSSLSPPVAVTEPPITSVSLLSRARIVRIPNVGLMVTAKLQNKNNRLLRMWLELVLGRAQSEFFPEEVEDKKGKKGKKDKKDRKDRKRRGSDSDNSTPPRLHGGPMPMPTMGPEERAQLSASICNLLQSPFPSSFRGLDKAGRFVVYFGAGPRIDTVCNLSDRLNFQVEEWQGEAAEDAAAAAELSASLRMYVFFQPLDGRHRKKDVESANREIKKLRAQIKALNEKNMKLQRVVLKLRPDMALRRADRKGAK